MSREGGIATFLKYGRQHIAAPGCKGYMVTFVRWFRGDKAEMNAWLRKRASEHQIARLVAAKLDARLAGGEACACEELPGILGPRGRSVLRRGAPAVGGARAHPQADS